MSLFFKFMPVSGCYFGRSTNFRLIMEQARLSNINLFVRDAPSAYQFYRQLFGFSDEPRMSHPPDFLVLDAGSCTLSFQPRQAVGMGEEPVGGIELGFEVADVNTTANLLQQIGGTLEQRNQMDWGTSVDGRDLDGHRITMYRRR